MFADQKDALTCPTVALTTAVRVSPGFPVSSGVTGGSREERLGEFSLN